MSKDVQEILSGAIIGLALGAALLARVLIEYANQRLRDTESPETQEEQE